MNTDLCKAARVLLVCIVVLGTIALFGPLNDVPAIWIPIIIAAVLLFVILVPLIAYIIYLKRSRPNELGC